jgi:serine/threonine-protein kinase
LAILKNKSQQEFLTMSGLIGQTLGHYELIEEVGRGGMATVCRAVDTRNDTEVAIKILSPTISGDNRFVRRFKREGSLLAGLDHPNIVPVLGYGDSKGMAYMVMPYIKGISLQERLERGRISKKERERWITQIAEALTFAHSKGIIHRDVKPSNVMVDKSGNALLTDFGLAREVEGSNTLTGSMLLGTPAYMAPEQGRGDLVDARSDQYSFGVILYQLVTGRLPFEADSPMGTVLKHIQEPVPRPSRFVNNMSPALERVILKCLAKDPEYRYPTVGAFFEAYKAAKSGASVADLDLETVVVPLDPTLREQADYYRAESLRGEVQQKRRSRIGLILVALLPLIVLGIIIVVPTFSDNLRNLFNLPPIPATAPSETANIPTASSSSELAPTQTPSPTPVPTPISIQEFVGAHCPDVNFYPLEFRGNFVVWKLDNEENSEVGFTLLDSITFPGDQTPRTMNFGNDVIWEGEYKEESIFLGEAAHQELKPSSVTEFSIEFNWSPAYTPYELTFDFENDCVFRGKW